MLLKNFCEFITNVINWKIRMLSQLMWLNILLITETNICLHAGQDVPTEETMGEMEEGVETEEEGREEETVDNWIKI